MNTDAREETVKLDSPNSGRTDLAGKKVVRNLALAAGMGGAMLLSSVAQASTTYDRARVIDADPIYRTVQYRVPVEACYAEERPVVRHHRRSATAPIVGAIIGGAIGNAVGHKKRNRQVGTAVGAILGGSIGADISRRHHRDYETVRYRTRDVCTTDYEVRESREIDGYNVLYEYGGTTYQTRMNRDPGDFIKVRVRVVPAHRG